MEFISYCSVSCVTSAVEKSNFLGSSFNFNGTTSSDIRPMRLRAQLDLLSNDKLHFLGG